MKTFMNLTITNLPDSSWPQNGQTAANAFKSVYNNLQALFTILKNYEGVYFDSVTYDLEFQDNYVYKKVTKTYTPAHADEEILYRKYIPSSSSSEIDVTTRYPNIQNSSNNLTVVDDNTTASSSQINISDVTPRLDDISISVGDTVERYARRLVTNCVDMDEGGRYQILCKSGSLTLRFYQYNNSTSYNYEPYFEGASTGATYRRGVVYDVYNDYVKTVDYCHNITSSSDYPDEARQGRVYSVVELDNAVGISFSDIKTGTSPSTNIGSFDLIITKSEKGKTVILSPRYVMITRETSSGSNTFLTADRLRMTSTIDLTAFPRVLNTNSYTYDKCQFNELTVLMNIPCCGVTDDFVKNVFVVPFTQYKFSTRRSNSIIKIGDTEYFYTGYLAIKG